MTLKSDLTDLGQRLAEIAARFDERARARIAKGIAPPGAGFLASAFHSLHDLFTRDVTSDGIRDLVRRDARETLHFFARAIDFDSLRALPWYQRFPTVAWKFFVAAAYRLSPPRRIAFVIAIILFLFSWIRVLSLGASQGETSDAPLWLVVSFAMLLLVLLLELKDKLGMKGDLEIAREIQFGLVPLQPIVRGEIRIESHMRPANTVGGDYYDVLELGPSQIAVVVGDVAGKGMPAALLMALLQGSLRTLISAGFRGAELIAKLNDYLCSSIPANSLITLFYGEIDTQNGALRYVNAGHNAPFWIEDGRTLGRLPATSTVLGILGQRSFEQQQMQLGRGERLLLFTDGISEAFNRMQEEYGEARIEGYLHSHARDSSGELIRGLIDDVLAFCGDARPSDDITLMIIGRLAATSEGGGAPQSDNRL